MSLWSRAADVPLVGRALRWATRWRRPVALGELLDTEPASRVFGLDRGTPIDRRYIEVFLTRSAALVQGTVLEVGDPTYTRRFGGARVRTSEVLHLERGAPGATLIGDLADPASLPAGRFDCFICTQTLQFVFELREAVRSCHQLLAPGGTLLVTLPGISQISRHDMDRWGDFWRFTGAAAARLFEPVFPPGAIAIETFGNALAATAFLNGLAVEDLPDPAALDHTDPDYPVIVAVRARKGPE